MRALLNHLSRSWLPKLSQIPVVWLALLPAALAASLSSCTLDTVHDGAVTALEKLPEGNYGSSNSLHRGGQPCLTCHGFQGPASSRFLVAGTVFWGPCNPTADPQKDPDNYKKQCLLTPARGVEVRIKDATNSTRCVVTNCAGNFFIRDTDWSTSAGQDMTFPLYTNIAKISKTGGEPQPARQMASHVGRAGSCADCHKQEAYADSPGQINLVKDLLTATAKPTEFTTPPACTAPQDESWKARECKDLNNVSEYP